MPAFGEHSVLSYDRSHCLARLVPCKDGNGTYHYLPVPRMGDPDRGFKGYFPESWSLEQIHEMIRRDTGDTFLSTAIRIKREDVTSKSQPKVRGFGSWYYHIHYFVKGQKIDGMIQVSRKHKRTETITCHSNSCVLGDDVSWLLRQNGYLVV